MNFVKKIFTKGFDLDKIINIKYRLLLNLRLNFLKINSPHISVEGSQAT